MRRAAAVTLGLVAVAFAASAQQSPRDRGAESTPLIDPDAPNRPGLLDPESHDAIDLYSRLCVSTRGDRDSAARIIGEGDSAIEKMDQRLLLGLENGQPGGVGWIIRMPLGEKLLVEFSGSGTCIVRAPRIDSGQLEDAFRVLLDQYGASGRFKVHREGDQTKAIDTEVKQDDDKATTMQKVKYHFLAYTMILPDTGQTAELGLATTDSRSVSFQGTLSFTLAAISPPDRKQ